VSQSLIHFGERRVPRPVRAAVAAEEHAAVVAAARIRTISKVAQFAQWQMGDVVMTELELRQAVPHADAYLSQISAVAAHSIARTLAELTL
jgi:hypothetical protein